MVKYIKIKEAERHIPNYEDYPNIHISGSLRGMRDIYNWDLKKVIQIGSYYYYMKGHPLFEDDTYMWED